MEVWKPVPGFHRYEVSDEGRVRSLDHISRNRNGEYLHKGRVLKPYTMPSGHLQLVLTTETTKANKLVHVLVMLAFEGPCPEGMEVLHEDHNPANNRRGNLKYGTRSENLKMDYAAGRRTVSPKWVYSANGVRKKPVEEYARLK